MYAHVYARIPLGSIFNFLIGDQEQKADDDRIDGESSLSQAEGRDLKGTRWEMPKSTLH